MGAQQLDPGDTIAAVGSPPGGALRGIVRLSGPDAIPLALAGFTPDDASAAEPPTDRAHWRLGRLQVGGFRPSLPASLLLWPGSRTYTGQPLAEIHTSGSQPVLALVLADRMRRGARLAEPGEFTLRAFLAGRLDLTRAEAVLGVIEARNPRQLDAALRQLAGGLFGPIQAARDRLLDVVAHLEAGLDFVDESDVDPIGRAVLASELAGMAGAVEELARTLRGRDRIDGAPRVVLVGPPNAGKSRLFNALVGLDRALVSSVAGTTRDYLCAPCDCDGLRVELVDTAGIEDAAGPIADRAQVHRADQAARADLLLDCRPADAGPGDQAIPTGDVPALIVVTKCDLSAAPAAGTLSTSSATGAGLPALRAAIAEALRGVDADSALPAGTAARCRESLAAAGIALRDASATLADGWGDELVALDLRLAVDSLGQVVGATVNDDILDRIFSRFCIGK
ncbi:tRNA modification GTPase [Isosphaeraceae bacterium EP7]